MEASAACACELKANALCSDCSHAGSVAGGDAVLGWSSDGWAAVGAGGASASAGGFGDEAYMAVDGRNVADRPAQPPIGAYSTLYAAAAASTSTSALGRAFMKKTWFSC